MIITAKAISVCSRYVDLLDFEVIKKEHPGRRDWHPSFEAEWIRKYQHQLNIDEIFKYTPDAKTTLSKVVFRTNDSYENVEAFDRDIYDHFDVSKYLYLEYICYQFTQKNPMSISYSSLAVTPVSSGQIYELTFNWTLEKAAMLKFAIHETESYPHRSLMVTPVFRRNYNMKDNTAQYNAFSSFSTSLSITNLPPPYETNCFDYGTIGLHSDSHCTQECVKREVIKKLNKMPFSVFVNESVHMKMISYQDVSEETISKSIFDIENKCSIGICSKRSCFDLTELTSTFETAYNEFLVRRNVPSDPNFVVNTNPAMKLVELLTYVLSTVSTWTGLSIMTLNPGYWMRKRVLSRKRRKGIHFPRKLVSDIIPLRTSYVTK
jgi:hypothetical protein